ncbi:uncharacterized protein LOC125438599 [Sphaerodactylus townsendi]|uniref:uncharacterized protein LOC125438599 n=1 Tax=Sphaerodactylus townsendi TaxID=933632 RepID=UPI002026C801|nr:uncharacterized protein LOC125438599 [Sphaerodactylus townsendi]
MATRGKAGNNGSNGKTPERNNIEMNTRLDQLTDLIVSFQEDVNGKLSKLDKLDQRFESFEKEILEIKKDLSQVKKIETSMVDLKKEVGSIKNEMTVTDSKVEIMKNQQEQLLDQMALMDLKLKENQLRIRGCKEEGKEDVRKKLITALGEFLEIEEEDLDQDIEKIFRVNSRFARNNHTPRDIIIIFERKRTRDEVLMKHSKERLKILGQEVIILKEVPNHILRKRKDYTPLKIG